MYSSVSHFASISYRNKDFGEWRQRLLCCINSINCALACWLNSKRSADCGAKKRREDNKDRGVVSIHQSSLNTVMRLFRVGSWHLRSQKIIPRPWDRPGPPSYQIRLFLPQKNPKNCSHHSMTRAGKMTKSQHSTKIPFIFLCCLVIVSVIVRHRQKKPQGHATF